MDGRGVSAVEPVEKIREVDADFEFTDEQIKLLKKYGDQITAIYYSEKNNKGKLKIQALDYPEI